MTNRRIERTDSKRSMRTVVIFCFAVFLLITTSVAIKFALLWSQNKFDSSHSFVLEIKNKNDAELIIFSPEEKSVSFLKVNDKNLAKRTLSRELGVPVDAIIPGDHIYNSQSELASYLFSLTFRLNSDTKELTPFDYLRLALFAQSADLSKSSKKEITLPLSDPEVNLIIGDMFYDKSILRDDVSLEIINASGILGAGNEVARLFGHIGVNVVAVRTSSEIKKPSTLSYFGGKTYTLKRISHLSDLEPAELKGEHIADIVLTIGDDKIFTAIFKK